MNTISILSRNPFKALRAVVSLLTIACAATSGFAQDEGGGALNDYTDDAHERREVPPEYANDPESPWARARDAQYLVATKPADALETLLWCYDHGTEKYPEYEFALRGKLPVQIYMLGQTYPPALEALKERAAKFRLQVSANPKKVKPDVTIKLAALDITLMNAPAIVDTLKLLPKGRAAEEYGELVRPLLIKMRHYREAVAIGSPETDFARRKVAMSERIDELKEYTRSQALAQIPAMKESTALVGVLYIEALAGVGEMERAKKLLRDVLKLHDSTKVRAALQHSLRRAGATELAESLVAAKM